MITKLVKLTLHDFVLSPSFIFKDLEKLYPDERATVQITLIEANEILSSFDTKLRSYTEKLIRKRERMKILKASVTSKSIILLVL